MRKKVRINDGWKFTKTGGGNPAELTGEWSPVTLPHTWNSEDGQDGGSDYYRGVCQYTRLLKRPVLQSGERVYLEFEAAAMKAEVCLNGKKREAMREATQPFVSILPITSQRRRMCSVSL